MSGEIWVVKGSRQIIHNVHRADRCAGRWCTIHNPMPGHWDNWPMILRTDFGTFMERSCPHGRWHPAIEDVINGFTSGIHKCDGCCQGRDADPDLDAGPGTRDEIGPLA